MGKRPWNEQGNISLRVGVDKILKVSLVLFCGICDKVEYPIFF